MSRQRRTGETTGPAPALILRAMQSREQPGQTQLLGSEGGMGVGYILT